MFYQGGPKQRMGMFAIPPLSRWAKPAATEATCAAPICEVLTPCRGSASSEYEEQQQQPAQRFNLADRPMRYVGQRARCPKTWGCDDILLEFG